MNDQTARHARRILGSMIVPTGFTAGLMMGWGYGWTSTLLLVAVAVMAYAMWTAAVDRGRVP